MTLYVPIAEARDVDDTLRVVNHPDGWVEGPELKGKTIAARQQYVWNRGQSGRARRSLKTSLMMWWTVSAPRSSSGYSSP
jgi:hypothetical protein